MEAMLKAHIEQQLHELGEDVSVEPDDDLVMVGFDSIAYVRLIAYLEQRFGIEIPDSDVTVEQFGTVANLSGYLQGRGASLEASSGESS